MNNKQHWLAFLMVITGSLGVLGIKWTDRLQSIGADGKLPRKFDHPFLQAFVMFLGEILCFFSFSFFTFLRRKLSLEENEYALMQPPSEPFNCWVLLPPALMDIAVAALAFNSLILTSPASFQMLKASVILFTGLLTVLFLRRKLLPIKWLGIGFIIMGLVIVGLADFKGRNGNVLGDLLVVLAQVFTACQIVYEENIIRKYNIPPSKIIGWEGIFGFFILGLFLIPMYFIHAPEPFGIGPRNVIEDAVDGYFQLQNNGELALAFAGTAISISTSKLLGVIFTKELSAITRILVADSFRTFLIWAVSLGLGWEHFYFLQPVGFLLLIIGMCFYSNILCLPFMQRWGLIPASQINNLLHDGMS